ncbi:hypothetical protein [Sinorhizobium meliloti]|uniref:hypothetical protein n=1 Tax=Rhizobium meliloti TaxID=382 RepID=UPI00192D9FB0|nr:hypothetical protein [Sinorhizobium meliloti]
MVTPVLVMPIPAVKPVAQGDMAIARVLKAVRLPGIGILRRPRIRRYDCLHRVAVRATELGAGLVALHRFRRRADRRACLLWGLPDRLGGALAAMIFVVIQSAGVSLIWIAPVACSALRARQSPAALCARLSGLRHGGCRAGAGTSSGLAMGVAVFNLSLGVLSPTLGLVAQATGLEGIFLITALLGLCTVPIAARLLSTTNIYPKGVHNDRRDRRKGHRHNRRKQRARRGAD